MPSLTIEDLILEFKRPILVDKNGCWNWLGSISSQGYAIYNNKVMYGIIYRSQGKECSQGKVLRHKCANKKCVNPAHIHEGTYSDNMIDSVMDGSRGLGRAVYKQMFDLKASGMSQSDISRKLNVTRSIVSMFFKGRLMCHKPEMFANRDRRI